MYVKLPWENAGGGVDIDGGVGQSVQQELFIYNVLSWKQKYLNVKDYGMMYVETL